MFKYPSPVALCSEEQQEEQQEARENRAVNTRTSVTMTAREGNFRQSPETSVPRVGAANWHIAAASDRLCVWSGQKHKRGLPSE